MSKKKTRNRNVKKRKSQRKARSKQPRLNAYYRTTLHHLTHPNPNAIVGRSLLNANPDQEDNQRSLESVLIMAIISSSGLLGLTQKKIGEIFGWRGVAVTRLKSSFCLTKHWEASQKAMKKWGGHNELIKILNGLKMGNSVRARILDSVVKVCKARNNGLARVAAEAKAKLDPLNATKIGYASDGDESA